MPTGLKANVDGSAALQVGGTDYLTVTSGGNTTFTQAANLPNTFGFKNRIINGAMVIDQRNAGASITLATGVQAYPVDRFPAFKGTSAATVTAQQSSVAPAGFVNSIIFTASTGSTPAVGDANVVWQNIEGFNVADFGWGTANAQTITVSFWVRSSVTGTYSVSFTNSASNRFYVATYTINAANTWEQKTITVAGDTSGTWVTNNGIGLQVAWDLGYGTNFNGSAGAWGSSTIRRTSGSVQLIATTGATFYITGVQLEKGSTATSFDVRPYGTEFQLCQRYLPAASGVGGSGGYFATGIAAGSNNFVNYVFKVTPRVSPTGITVSSASHFGCYNGLTTFTASGVTFNAATLDGCFLLFTGGTFTAGTAVGAYYASASGLILFNGCEL